MAVALGAVALVVLCTVHLTRRRRRRRARAVRTWADAQLARLERAGERRGAPRRPHQTVREYERVLVSAGVPSTPLRHVVDAIDTESFSGRPLAEDERRYAELALADLEARATGPGHPS
jgi:hypothetical protein